MADLNAFNPTCAVNLCLREVIGYNGSPAEQFSSCISQFGSPEIISVTLPVSVVFSTTTTTVPYIDITVTTSTAFSTVNEFTTTTVEAPETTTEFTATRVTTTTVQVTAQVTFLKKIKKRKSPCKASSPSSAPTDEPSVTSVLPSSISSSPSSLSLSVAPSATPSAACADIAAYSSACSCIYAVDSQTTVTVPGSVSTSTITESASSAVPTISTTVITELVTESVTDLTTSTVTTTIKTIADTTSTSTNIIQPTVTGAFRTNPLNKALVINASNRYAGQGIGAGTQLQVDGGSGKVTLAEQPAVELYASLVNSQTAYAVLKFNTAAQVTANDKPLTCLPDSAGVLSCSAGGALNTIFSCASYIYISKPDWNFSGCTAVKIGLATA